MSVTLCRQYCRGQGYRYAGVAVMRRCYCVTLTDKSLLVATSHDQCDLNCSGDNAQRCGSLTNLNLYDVGKAWRKAG